MSRKEIIEGIRYNLDVATSMGSNKKTIKKLNKQLQNGLKLK